MAHIAACIFIDVGYLYPDSWLRNPANGVGFEHDQVWKNYSLGVYWVMTTFTTVGYGDYAGKTSGEYVLSILFEMTGIMFSAFTIGIVSQSFISQTGYSNDIAEKLAELDVWLKKIEISRKHESETTTRFIHASLYYEATEYI